MSDVIVSYIARYPVPVQKILKTLRSAIKRSAPHAIEKIAYGIPTFFLHRNLVHFSAAKNHIGFYPSPAAIEKFKRQLRQYKTSKGAIQFPIDRPLPLALIQKIVEFRVLQEEDHHRAENASDLPKISMPAARAFERAKIRAIKDLAKWSEEDLLDLHGIGPKTLRQLKPAMRRAKIKFVSSPRG